MLSGRGSDSTAGLYWESVAGPIRYAVPQHG